MFRTERATGTDHLADPFGSARSWHVPNITDRYAITGRLRLTIRADRRAMEDQ